MAEYMSTGQIYSDENPHKCHCYKYKLFALSFDMWCPTLNFVFTIVVTAKHSANKENRFGKLVGGPKHLKHIFSISNKFMMAMQQRQRLFQCYYLCPASYICVALIKTENTVTPKCISCMYVIKSNKKLDAMC